METTKHPLPRRPIKTATPLRIRELTLTMRLGASSQNGGFSLLGSTEAVENPIVAGEYQTHCTRYLDVQLEVDASMGCKLLINGVNWGHNPFTNHSLVLTSWDIQVLDVGGVMVVFSSTKLKTLPCFERQN